MDSALDLTPTHSTLGDPTLAVQTFRLSKVYRTGFWLHQSVTSLQACSLEIPQGETFGLLGPNGAGKTTLLKLLLGLARPTTGRGFLLGYPLGHQAIRQKVGFLPENPYFYQGLTGWELLELTAGLFCLPPSVQRKRIPHLLDLVGLAHSTARKKALRQYSKGMLQRIGMAQALVNDPEILFLDEPMSGLDPLGRYQLREIILSLKSQGKTIFFNSHVLADVEKICDRVAILASGELLCLGSLDQLLGSDPTYWIEGRGGDPTLLQRHLTHLEITPMGWRGQLQTEPTEFIPQLAEGGGQVDQLQRGRPSLEEFFVEQLRQRQITVRS